MKNQKNKIQIVGGDPLPEGTAAKNSSYENGKPRSSSSSSNSKGNTAAPSINSLGKGVSPEQSAQMQQQLQQKNTAPKVKKKGFIKKKSEQIRKLHQEGNLSSFISDLFTTFGSYITLLIMVLTLPAMPVIFYLTILYNVIILTWEKFKNLDTYAGTK